MYTATHQEFKESLFSQKWNIEIEKYDDIKGELPLLKDVYIEENCHAGQRKLLLNEIKFYSEIPEGSTIVY